MDQESILEELQYLKKEIFSGKTKNLYLGEHKTKVGGAGFEIRDIEEWRRGDYYSSINWPLSLASYPEKIYKLDRIETRETPVAIIADCSPSMLLGFDPGGDKLRLILNLIGSFSFTASYFHDSVAIALGGIEGESFVPLRHGHGHVMMTVHHILGHADAFHRNFSKGKSIPVKGLDLNQTIQLMAYRVKRQSTVIIMSDFMDAITGKAPLDMEIIEYLSGKHKQNVIALFLEDDSEFAWSGVGGTVLVRNIETGRVDEVKAKEFRLFLKTLGERRSILQKNLSDAGVESVVLSWNNHSSRLADFMMSRINH